MLLRKVQSASAKASADASGVSINAGFGIESIHMADRMRGNLLKE